MPVTEKKLIQRIRRLAGKNPSLVMGIGDDAAVLRIPAGHEVLVTTDFSLENVHFRREWHCPQLVGWRCLTRGLSDIAAMGGEPRAAFLSLALGRDVPETWVQKFLEGLLALARKHGVALAGGDTAESLSGIQADITVVGSVPKGKAVLRSGARPNQQIYVTGALGGPASALSELMLGQHLGRVGEGHLRPHLRLAVGQWLRRHRLPCAMIDISDGLSTDLEHICQESQVGADLVADAIPRARSGPGKNRVDLRFALHGGDDYELLFTSARKVPATIEGVAVSRIGQTTSRTGMRLIDAHGTARRLDAGGWEHFRQES
jgi:thiamine-monophosphate kinase